LEHAVHQQRGTTSVGTTAHTRSQKGILQGRNDTKIPGKMARKDRLLERMGTSPLADEEGTQKRPSRNKNNKKNSGLGPGNNVSERGKGTMIGGKGKL